MGYAYVAAMVIPRTSQIQGDKRYVTSPQLQKSTTIILPTLAMP